MASFILPTLNEAQNIGLLIDQIKNLYKAEIIIADDGSTDGTLDIAKEHNAKIIDRSCEQIKGITASAVAALGQVSTDKIVVMDADFQHPPETAGEIIKKLENNDIVIAVRKRVIGNWRFSRRIQSKIATFLANLRLGDSIEDPLSGFFGINAEMFNSCKKENFELRCFKVLFNILKNVDFKKVKIGYVYYDFNMRQGGESKIRLKHTYYFLMNLLK